MPTRDAGFTVEDICMLSESCPLTGFTSSPWATVLEAFLSSHIVLKRWEVGSGLVVGKVACWFSAAFRTQRSREHNQPQQRLLPGLGALAWSCGELQL